MWAGCIWGILTWSSLVKFKPAALRMEASVIMASPMMNATTGLAWCAGTGSSRGTSGTAVGASEMEVAVRVADSMQDHVVV